jgi:hypothetical protein
VIEPREFRHSPFPPSSLKKGEKKIKQGGGAYFIFDILSITLVVSGLPIDGVVCLSKCSDDVVDCSCECAGQLVYGPRISFLGHYIPCRCKTVWPIVSEMPIYHGFLNLHVF